MRWNIDDVIAGSTHAGTTSATWGFARQQSDYDRTWRSSNGLDPVLYPFVSAGIEHGLGCGGGGLLFMLSFGVVSLVRFVDFTTTPFGI